MSKIIICTWMWGDKYGREYVDRLEAGVRRYYRKPFEWRVFEPDSYDAHLTWIPGCFCRLRMFDREWQSANGIESGQRVVCLDLDSIVTGPLEPLFERDERFVILAGANSMNPNPFNGSVMMFRGRAHSELWTKFSLEAARTIRHHEYPDDQGWYWHMIPNAAYWRVGSSSGIYAFCKPGWPKYRGDELPSDARIVVFPGRRDPSQFTHLPWIQERWINLAGVSANL